MRHRIPTAAGIALLALTIVGCSAESGGGQPETGPEETTNSTGPDEAITENPGQAPGSGVAVVSFGDCF